MSATGSELLNWTGLSYYDQKIKAIIGAVSQAVSDEASARTLADSQLGGRVTNLENAGYATQSYVNTMASDAKNGAVQEAKDYTDGYAYSKSAIDSMVNQLQSQLNFTIVQTLPTASTSYGKGIFLIDHHSGQNDYYDEYIVVRTDDGAGSYAYEWEHIGTTAPSITNLVPNTRTVNGHPLSSDVTVTKADVGLGQTANGAQVNVIETVKVNGTALTVTSKAVNIDLSGYVPTTRKVNGHALSSDVTVTKSDIGLGNTVDGAQVNVIETVKVNGTALTITSKAVNIDLSGYVPTTRKVNNKPLSSDITLSASDIGITTISNADIDTLFAS